jgi:hypothetical protein
MSAMELKLYDLLEEKLSATEAQSIVEFVQNEIKSELEDKPKILATKEDIYKLDVKIEQTKNDTIKWLFGFWVTLVLLILANWFFKK